MQQITGSKKFPEGIQVSWSEQGNDLNDFFSYEELIAQKVNVLDVLNNPKNYQVNKAGHQIELFVRCGIPSCAYEDEIVISRLFDAPRDLPGGYGPSLILLCNGGGQKTTLHPSQKSISVWWKIPLLYAIARRPRLLEYRCVPGDCQTGADRLHRQLF